MRSDTLRDDPRDDIVGTCRGKTHEEADRLSRIYLRMRAWHCAEPTERGQIKEQFSQASPPGHAHLSASSASTSNYPSTWIQAAARLRATGRCFGS
jgi:hypothetical protein